VGSIVIAKITIGSTSPSVNLEVSVSTYKTFMMSNNTVNIGLRCCS